MIQTFTEDTDGSTAIELDDEGIEYLIEGLSNLRDEEIGCVLSSPAVWTKSSPWWRFWNRSGDPVVGEIRLRKVA